MKKLFTTLALATALSLTAAHAAKPMKMGTGGINGTYNPMGDDMIGYCAAEVSRPIENIEQSNGSVGNLLDMVNKKLHMGMTQIDTLVYYGKKVMPTKVNQNRYKVIADLHLEYGHVVIPPGWSPKSSGFNWGSALTRIGIGSKNEKGISIDILKGQKVGASGGSLVSTQALSSFLGLSIKPINVPKGSLVDHPVLIVEGQPSETVQGYLAQGWTLLPIDADTLKAKSPVYEKVTLSYAVNGNVISVPSFGVRAVLIGKASRNASRNKPMQEFATCIMNSLEELSDDTDTNPNWESVFELNDEGSQIDWSYFDLIEKK